MGFEEIRIGRATFALFAYENDGTKELVGMLAVHVDDGIVFDNVHHAENMKFLSPSIPAQPISEPLLPASIFADITCTDEVNANSKVQMAGAGRR